MGRSHAVLGASAGLAYGQLAGLPLWQVGVSAAVASTFAAGRLSPDVDQAWWWRTLARVVPGRALGHRRLSHSPLVPLVAWVVADRAGWALGWVVFAGIAGWVSHLVGDTLVGERSPSRGPGIPWLGWRGHWGLGFKCGGWLEESLVRWVLPVVLVAQVGWCAGLAPVVTAVVAGG